MDFKGKISVIRNSRI